MSREEPISEWYANAGDRKATISRDKYHFIARLFDVLPSGLLREYDTVLLNDVSLRYVEDLCENFVERVGKFK